MALVKAMSTMAAGAVQGAPIPLFLRSYYSSVQLENEAIERVEKSVARFQNFRFVQDALSNKFAMKCLPVGVRNLLLFACQYPEQFQAFALPSPGSSRDLDAVALEFLGNTHKEATEKTEKHEDATTKGVKGRDILLGERGKGNKKSKEEQEAYRKKCLKDLGSYEEAVGLVGALDDPSAFYVENVVMNEAEWGGELEAHAIAWAQNKTIQVFRIVGGNYQLMWTVGRGPAADRALLWCNSANPGASNNNENHYQAIRVPVAGTPYNAGDLDYHVGDGSCLFHALLFICIGAQRPTLRAGRNLQERIQDRRLMRAYCAQQLLANFEHLAAPLGYAMAVNRLSALDVVKNLGSHSFPPKFWGLYDQLAEMFPTFASEEHWNGFYMITGKVGARTLVLREGYKSVQAPNSEGFAELIHTDFLENVLRFDPRYGMTLEELNKKTSHLPKSCYDFSKAIPSSSDGPKGGVILIDDRENYKFKGLGAVRVIVVLEPHQNKHQRFDLAWFDPGVSKESRLGAKYDLAWHQTNSAVTAVQLVQAEWDRRQDLLKDSNFKKKEDLVYKEKYDMGKPKKNGQLNGGRTFQDAGADSGGIWLNYDMSYYHPIRDETGQLCIVISYHCNPIGDTE